MITDLQKKFNWETGNNIRMDWTDDIGTMRAYAEWLESRLTWLPASEKPEKDGEYLCKLEFFNLIKNCLDTYTEKIYYTTDGGWNEDVLFWMEIPELPKEVKK